MPVTLQRRRGSQPFNPRMVANLKGWYDANKITGVADGAAPTSWPDSSGNALDLAQATSTKRALWRQSTGPNSRSWLDFDGVDDIFSVTYGAAVAQPHTIFGVTRMDTAPGANARRRWFGGPTSGILFMGAFNDTTGLTATWELFGGLALKGANYDTGVWHIHVGVHNGASSNVRVDGGAGVSGNASNNNLNGVTLGADGTGSSLWDGGIAEAIVYNAALSVANINRIGKYLAKKYGLTWTTAT